MKSLRVLGALLGMTSSVLAQQTPTQLQSTINGEITANGHGAITGTVLNNLLLNMNSSYGNVLATNTWAVAQRFAALPIFTSCSGYVYANGGAPATCVTSGGGGGATYQSLTVTGVNTISPLTGGTYTTGAGGGATLWVNGQGFTDSDSPVPFTVAGTAITWNATNAGFALATTDVVTIAYSSSSGGGGGGSSGPILGDITAATSAPAGYVGEIQTSSTTSLALANGVAFTALEITLSAGHWECNGSLVITNTSNNLLDVTGAINLTGSSVASAAYGFAQTYSTSSNFQVLAIAVPSNLFNLTSTTSVYLNGQTNYTAGTVTGKGSLTCRRIF